MLILALVEPVFVWQKNVKKKTRTCENRTRNKFPRYVFKFKSQSARACWWHITTFFFFSSLLIDCFFFSSYTRCDCCDGPMFGRGVRVIKAPSSIFGVKNLPFLFNACTQTCRRQFSRASDSLKLWMQRNAPHTLTEL